MVVADGAATAEAGRRERKDVAILGGVDQDLARKRKTFSGNGAGNRVAAREDADDVVLQDEVDAAFAVSAGIDLIDHLLKDFADGRRFEAVRILAPVAGGDGFATGGVVGLHSVEELAIHA